MKISRLRPLGTTALGLSLCCGLISTSHFPTAVAASAQSGGQQGGGQQGGGQQSGGQQGGGTLLEVLNTLSLTADQKTAIQAILDAAKAKITALNQDTTLTMEKKLAAHKAISDDSIAKIEKLLTDDQKATLEAWLAKRAAGNQGGKSGGGKGGDGGCKPTPTPTTTS